VRLPLHLCPIRKRPCLFGATPSSPRHLISLKRVSGTCPPLLVLRVACERFLSSKTVPSRRSMVESLSKHPIHRQICTAVCNIWIDPEAMSVAHALCRRAARARRLSSWLKSFTITFSDLLAWVEPRPGPISPAIPCPNYIIFFLNNGTLQDDILICTDVTDQS
jgi:hypothetical protein